MLGRLAQLSRSIKIPRGSVVFTKQISNKYSVDPLAGQAEQTKPQVTLKVDGKSVAVPVNSTILDACKKAKSYVPTLCYHPMLRIVGQCRVCLVEIATRKNKLVPACATKVEPGMEINTDSEQIQKSGKRELIMILVIINLMNIFSRSKPTILTVSTSKCLHDVRSRRTVSLISYQPIVLILFINTYYAIVFIYLTKPKDFVNRF